jgi:hypothetical protein
MPDVRSQIIAEHAECVALAALLSLKPAGVVA